MRDCSVNPNLYASYINYNNMKSHSTGGYSKNCALANHNLQADTLSFGSGEKELLKQALKETEKKIHRRIDKVAAAIADRAKAEK